MKVDLRFASTFFAAIFLILALSVGGCSRSAVRTPVASTSLPESPTGYVAQNRSPSVLVVSNPVDQRFHHYGEPVAGTKLKDCSTDALWGSDVTQLIQQRLIDDIQASGLFSGVVSGPAGPNDIVMKTEIYAFCAQSAGLLRARLAGVSALRIGLEQNGKILLDRKFEKVVTDADKKYRSSQETIEQATKATMADSLRELIKDMLKQIESESISWKAQN